MQDDVRNIRELHNSTMQDTVQVTGKLNAYRKLLIIRA